MWLLHRRLWKAKVAQLKERVRSLGKSPLWALGSRGCECLRDAHADEKPRYIRKGFRGASPTSKGLTEVSVLLFQRVTELTQGDEDAVGDK
ncbi:hypothetical protein JRQ81_013720 [Phrynocephalus forsythii]|uniref:Uncharacterized protein n=1 Tax=Phrynocephalus forsythii TaxID=171643 RepID=A0A9Q0XZQ6_9SAUR|nr:hypothetical protein JRQ81_013720 [Phrynocephalus forsythii]